MQTPAYMLERSDERRIPFGQVLRYPEAKKVDPSRRMFDGYANFYFHTASREGLPKVQLERGISSPAIVALGKGMARVPALLLRSSPSKVGTHETPWEDVFDLDNGYVRYFGDGKAGLDPTEGRGGNRKLLEQFRLHQSPDRELRELASPLLFFRGVSREGKQKGFVEFCGLGLLVAAERVSQVDANGKQFVNYAFDCALLELLKEDETFDWRWVNARRELGLTNREANTEAPHSWKEWIKHGDTAVPRLRRSVARRSVVSKSEQIPPEASKTAEVLTAVYEHYKGQEIRFEGVAAWVTARILRRSGIYRPFGVTRASGDRGFDFLGRLTLGSPEAGFGGVQSVVLGQAKCESPNSPTNALHLARTVARLRRGWLGVFVTTSHFSRSAQEEVIQDRYPLLMVNGQRLASEICSELHERGYPPLEVLLNEIEREFGISTEITDPDQVLFRD